VEHCTSRRLEDEVAVALAHCLGRKDERDATVCLMTSSASSNRPGDSSVATFPPKTSFADILRAAS